MNWDIVSNLLIAAATVAMAIFSYFLWRLQEKLAWFTGAMESHSELMVRLEAKKQGIKTFWVDPNDEKWPQRTPGQSAEPTEIRIGIPLKQRTEEPSPWYQVKFGWRAIIMVGALVVWTAVSVFVPLTLDNMRWHLFVTAIAAIVFGAALSKR